MLVVGAVVAVLLTVGGAGWLVYGNRDAEPAAAGVLAETRSSRTGPSSASPQARPSTGSPATSHPTTTTPDAGASLRAAARADRASVSSLEELWVPQLSSKVVGMVADGIIYDEEAIARHVASLRGTYPGALLLNSSDYASFQTGGMWVVIVGSGYETAAGANSWCEQMRIGRDDCFAKRLTQDGPSGNTKPR